MSVLLETGLLEGNVSRIDLKVPYSDKDQAKELGAKWDAIQKVWYVPDGLQLWLFEPWFTDSFKMANPQITSENYNIRGNSFFIIKTISPCPFCSAPTELITFVPAEDHFQLEIYDEQRYWHESLYGEEVLWGVKKLNPPALAAAQAISSHYKRCIKISKKSGREYTGPFVSHCVNCGKAHPEMRSDHCHPLYPATVKEAKKIYRYYFQQEFKANTTYTNPFEAEGLFEAMPLVRNIDTEDGKRNSAGLGTFFRRLLHVSS